MVADRLAAHDGAHRPDATSAAEALEDALRLARAGAGGDELPPVEELAGELADWYEQLGRPDDTAGLGRLQHVPQILHALAGPLARQRLRDLGVSLTSAAISVS